jgi:UDP-glucose 4-epimerase
VREIRGCPVAVIGGAGFLGSHLCEHLLTERGCRVVVIDNLSIGRMEHVHPDAVFEKYDITGSEEGLQRLFEKHRIRYALNYAAVPFVPSGFTRPLPTFEVTAAAVLKVLVACERAGVEGLLQVGSGEIYGNSHGSIGEDDVPEPHSTYGVSKLAADGLVRVRWKEAGTRAMVMRQFNCYGPQCTWPYVIPTIISQLAEGPVVFLGNNSRRDFQYCGDAVRMAVELLECGDWGGVYNMGSESSVLIFDLAQLIGKLMGHDEVRIEVDPARVRPKDVEIWHLCSDNAKLYGAIKRRPETPLEEGLRKTIDAYHRAGKRWAFQE